MKNKELKEAIKNFVIFFLSYSIITLGIRLENFWIKLIFVAVLAVIFERLFEKIEYKIIDCKTNNERNLKQDEDSNS